METWLLFMCVCGTNNSATSECHGRSVQFNFFCTILLVVTTKQSISHNAMATRNETKKVEEINRTKVERWRPSLAKYLLHSRCHHNASHFAEQQDKWRVKKYITKSKSKQCAAAAEATTARGRGSIFSLSNTNFNVSESCFHYIFKRTVRLAVNVFNLVSLIANERCKLAAQFKCAQLSWPSPLLVTPFHADNKGTSGHTKSQIRRANTNGDSDYTHSFRFRISFRFIVI